MTSIKVKFCPSAAIGLEGTIYYVVIKKRMICKLMTDYQLFEHEWDKKTNRVIVADNERCAYLHSLENSIRSDMNRLHACITHWENNALKYSAEDIRSQFRRMKSEYSLSSFMQTIIIQLGLMGKQRTSEAYRATLKSFMRFREGNDLFISEINSEMLLLYEAYLHKQGITKNTSSFYMRVLRAVYNRAVDKNLIANKKPFKHVYTGIDKTIKRAIPLKAIKQIKSLDLSSHHALDFARDMFLFSFYTRGMSFIDMAHLKKEDLQDGILSYKRRKTGQQLFIRWEVCMQQIVNKHHTDASNPYLLPILKYPYENRNQYKYAISRTNKLLKDVAKLVGLATPLTLYVARHSWASVARSKNIAISIISEAMGHDSEKTTRIYLASLDNGLVDRANAQILNEL